MSFISLSYRSSRYHCLSSLIGHPNPRVIFRRQYQGTLYLYGLTFGHFFSVSFISGSIRRFTYLNHSVLNQAHALQVFHVSVAYIRYTHALQVFQIYSLLNLISHSRSVPFSYCKRKSLLFGNPCRREKIRYKNLCPLFPVYY